MSAQPGLAPGWKRFVCAPSRGGTIMLGRLGESGDLMRKAILLAATFAIVACDGLSHGVSADGIAVIRQSKKVHRSYHGSTCGYDGRCVPVGCPDRYSCYSLYGAYGPYGGAAYWNRYTYEGWGYR
jgi:hypothetical protein